MAKDHVLLLGKLSANIHSLEAILRAYLLSVGQRENADAVPRHSYFNLAVGDEITEDEFSNFDTLGDLVDKYNRHIGARDQSLVVDRSVVEVRDILAHGRVAGDREDTATLRIVKFAKPKGGKARVVASALMDDDWFGERIQLVLDQILKVGIAYKRLAS